MEDEAVLMSVQPVLTCGIIRDASLYDHLRENATSAISTPRGTLRLRWVFIVAFGIIISVITIFLDNPPPILGEVVCQPVPAAKGYGQSCVFPTFTQYLPSTFFLVGVLTGIIAALVVVYLPQILGKRGGQTILRDKRMVER